MALRMSIHESQATRGPRWLIALVLGAAAGVSYCALNTPRKLSWESIEATSANEEWSEAEDGIRRWLREHPADGKAWNTLGHLLVKTGRSLEAAEALERVPEGGREWTQAQRQLAELAVQRGDLTAAEGILRNAAWLDPKAVEPLERLAWLLALERRLAESRDVLRRLFELSRDPRPLADSILLARLEGEVRDLGPEVERFVTTRPDDPWLRRLWGLALLARGRPAEALPQLEFAAQSFDDDPVGRFALAECKMALGTLAPDFDILGTRPARNPDAARWWVFRSRLALAWGEEEEAVASLGHAVELDPRNSEAHHRLAQALLQRGDREAARPHLDRAEALGIADDRLRTELRRVMRGDGDVAAFRSLAQLCLEAGMTVEARDWSALASQRGSTDSVVGRGSAHAEPEDRGPTIALSRPRLRSQRTEISSAREPVASAAGTRIRFEEVAKSAGLIYHYDCGQTPNLFVGDTMGGGVGLIDYDGDGWLDIYFVNGCSLPVDPAHPPQPNRLFRNLGGMRFVETTGHAGIAGRGYGMGCAVGDFDQDGRDDLFVTGLSGTILYRNRGDGTFEDLTTRAGVHSARWSTAAGFADLDMDSDLDLYVVTYLDADPRDGLECRDRSGRLIHCQPERFAAQRDHLFQNNGDGTFTDVSREAGIDQSEGRGLGLAIADFDGDDRLDIFVANDGTANHLFRNLGGLRFEDVAITAGAAYDAMGQPTASMGVVADDLNADGNIDLLHTNFINQGSTLRWNGGQGFFVDGSLAANLAVPSRSRTGWGVAAADFENDGDLDLFVANGHVDDQPWLNTPMAQLPQLFVADDTGRYQEAGAEASPYLTRRVTGRGLAAGDLDHDGRMDLVIVHRDGPAAILHNQSNGGHWLGVQLRSKQYATRPIGARVTCQAGGRSMVRWITSGTSYLASSDPRIFFGLASSAMVEELKVRWPSGREQSWSNLAADRIIELGEGSDVVATLGSSPSPR